MNGMTLRGPDSQHGGGTSSAPLDVLNDDPGQRLAALAAQARANTPPTPPGYHIAYEYTVVTVTRNVTWEADS